MRAMNKDRQEVLNTSITVSRQAVQSSAVKVFNGTVKSFSVFSVFSLDLLGSMLYTSHS